MRPLRIYVAGSWRDPSQPLIVEGLRAAGLDVYDFRHPDKTFPDASLPTGFSWSEIDPDWQCWSSTQFREALGHHLARTGRQQDIDAMCWADVGVLIVPETAGRSSHLEAGWFAGHPSKRLIILLTSGEPELMYGLADYVVEDLAELVAVLT